MMHCSGYSTHVLSSGTEIDPEIATAAADLNRMFRCHRAVFPAIPEL
jgi:hypothetical protein